MVPHKQYLERVTNTRVVMAVVMIMGMAMAMNVDNKNNEPMQCLQCAFKVMPKSEHRDSLQLLSDHD
jgi:hypothetical protein